MKNPVYCVDTADNLAHLEARLNRLAEQRFEPWMIMPVPSAGDSPLWFVIIAIQHPRVEAIADLDYRAALPADHEGPTEPVNGCRAPSITAAIPRFDLGRR